MKLGPETRHWRRLGLRREVLILLPVALLLLVVLSTFTLFSFRNALDLLAQERQRDAAHLARAVAARLASGSGAFPRSARELQEVAPGALGAALADVSGAPLDTVGEIPPAGLLAPAAGLVLDQPLGVGPDELLPDAVAGFAPLGSRAERRYVRIDLPAGALAGQRRSLAVLTVFVLTINGALMLLVLLFLRHLLAPWETLIARARAMGVEGDEDEIQFLLATFERALSALAGREGRAEDDIAALERTLAPSLESGLLLLDREGSVLALNAVGAALLGTGLPEPGRPLSEVLSGQPELLEVLSGAIAEGSTLKRQECTVRSGAETRTVGLTVHPLRRDDGGVRGHLVLFADLTEVLRQAEESRLEESLARLGEMAGGVAHELRNSLATLRGYLTLIERRPDEDSIADFLSEIRHEADHLERVLQDFLSFARPGTARLQELSLARLLARAAADPVLSGVEIRLLGGGDAVLKGDPQLLERAVRNLLHNAAEAEREAGRAGPVEVSVEPQADGVEVAIEDRGPGLVPEVRGRLFHPFATGRRGGVGLGLSLAHRIVTLHGGRIRLEDRPGGGTRAVLFFPRDTIVTTGNEPPPGADLPAGAGKIL
ncbi:MAG TPA: ATP-binding protein [Thermoanaerobaculia bacterium]|nr:ATP-binding protein [Thermoanaerobaculia bacterium]